MDCERKFFHTFLNLQQDWFLKPEYGTFFIFLFLFCFTCAMGLQNMFTLHSLKKPKSTSNNASLKFLFGISFVNTGAYIVIFMNKIKEQILVELKGYLKKVE